MPRINTGAALCAALFSIFLTFADATALSASTATPNPQPPPSPACTGSDPTTVWTNSSKTTPALCGAQASNGVSAYVGIPYVAQQPTAANRWTDGTTANWPPSPAMQAVNVQNQCMQVIPAWNTNPPPMGEDCLYLNVWAPTATLNTPSAKLPVMVFIHGGAFITGAGSNPIYNGAALAENGVIVVTLNYRLGSFGFLAADVSNGKGHGVVGLNGNFGLNDQRAALQWVQNSVAAFGGDPAQVTLFGESAGAMSTGLHLFASPPSKELFKAAIMESNPIGSFYRTLDETQAQGAAFIKKLCKDWHKGPSLTCPKTMQWLASLTADQILQSQASFIYLGSGNASAQNAPAADISGMGALGGNIADSLPWSPTVDQKVVTAQPAAGFASGMPVKPFAFGTNDNEGVIFAAMIANGNAALTKKLFALSPAEYDVILSRVFSDKAVRTKIKAYQNAQQQTPYAAPAANPPDYYGKTQKTNGTAQTINYLINDFAFQCANLSTAAKAYAQITDHAATPIYGYHFAQPPIFNFYKTSNGASIPACDPSNGNVCHADELPYVFSTLKALVGSVPAGDASVAAAMTQAWAAFAKNPASASGFTPYTPTGNLIQYAYTNTASPSAPLAVTALDQAHNCSALWNPLNVYP